MSASPPDSLTYRAVRTASSKFSLQGTRMFVALLATPFIVRALGKEQYGAWLVLQQWVSYLALLDFQAMGTLKLKLGLEQKDEDASKKRRLVGAALKLWFYLLPLWLIASVALVVIAPTTLPLVESNELALQIAMALSAFTVILGRIISIPANVLRGMNEDFRVVLPSTLIVLLGGFLSVVSVACGLGLPGLAASALVASLFSSAIEYKAARRFCPWFGAEPPDRNDMKSFFFLSRSVFFNSFFLMLLFSSDYILAAHLLSPEKTAVLGATGAALRMLSEPFIQFMAASNAGILGLVGSKEFPRVAALRSEQRRIACSFMAILGTGTVLLNEPFLNLWLGHSYFGGTGLTLALVALSFITVLVKIDSVFLISMGGITASNRLIQGSVAISLVISAYGALNFGLSGLVFGMIVGRVFLFWGQSSVIDSYMLKSEVPAKGQSFRVLAASAILVSIGLYLAPYFRDCGLVQICLAAVLCAAFCCATIYLLAFSKKEKEQFHSRALRVDAMFGSFLPKLSSRIVSFRRKP